MSNMVNSLHKWFIAMAAEASRDDLNNLCGPVTTLEEVAAASERLRGHASDEPQFTAEEVAMAQAPWSLLSPPQPQEPTDDELNDLFCKYQFATNDDHSHGVLIEMIRDALRSYGRPAVVPVPVSERLPGPKDCCGNPRNGEGRWCWGRVWPQTAAGTPVVWRLMWIDCLMIEAVEWAPWWALPIPGQPDHFPDAGEMVDQPKNHSVDANKMADNQQEPSKATRPLSPASHEILAAQVKARCLREWSTVNDPSCHPSDSDREGCSTCIDHAGTAAALRAAAAQLGSCNAATELRRWADELEGQP